MGEIKLLDCTLRDGGHVVQGKFGEKTIKSIISNLVDANIDIIEVGFLWPSETDADTARFNAIEKVKRYLPLDLKKSKISLMADNVDLTDLEPYDGTVEFIRLSFRMKEIDWVKRTAELVKAKGYKCYINPIHGSSLSDLDYLELIKMVNEIKPYGFSIVDTFGAMRQTDLGRLYYLIEHNLDPDIEVGIHLHENLGLAYSLAQYILQIVSPIRKVAIDGSLFGMGKIPGNLCIEQIMDYLNVEYHANYSTEPVYDAIDQYIMPIFEKIRWGYSIPYAISAQCGVHRTYAEYLSKKERLRTKDIRRLLNTIDIDNSETYDESYIEEKYKQYMNTAYNDGESLISLGKSIDSYDKVVIIAPGSSIKNYIFNNDLLEDACVISVNFEYKSVETDYVFYTNAKRFALDELPNSDKLIITSNLKNEIPNAAYIISRNELVYHNDVWSDDSTLMLLNLLKRLGVKNIYIAGFDGFVKSHDNFYTKMLEREVRDEDYDIQVRINILKEVYSTLNIEFLTESIYKKALMTL